MTGGVCVAEIVPWWPGRFNVVHRFSGQRPARTLAFFIEGYGMASEIAMARNLAIAAQLRKFEMTLDATNQQS